MLQPFYHLNLLKDPLITPIDKLATHTGMKVADLKLLNPDLLEFFNKLNISCKDFVIWVWSSKMKYPIHTDGDWFGTVKRSCGINWNFSPDTEVVFYSTENGIPVFHQESTTNFATHWDFIGDPIKVAAWRGPGPVLFNPQIPHIISYDNPTNSIRCSITLRFNESFESLYKKIEVFINDK